MLRNSRGMQRTFPDPGSCVVLPVGTYHLERIILQGGHDYRPDQASPDSLLTVDANVPATLKVGAPLRQVVRTEREGSTMVLGYELIGQGGECYSISRTEDNPAPSFAVYRGDRKVASGDFEFG